MSKRNKSAYEKFEKLMNERGVTAYKVAKDTNISKGTLSAWKHDTYDIKLSTLDKIADYFGVSVVYFIE